MHATEKRVGKNGAPPEAEHPSGDPRFKMLDATLKKSRYAPDSLIEILHAAQGLFGFLGEDVLHYVAHALKLPPSRVLGVATFYHLFSLKPQGEHSCTVCLGTACYVKGAQAIVDAVTEAFHLQVGHTDPDGTLSFGSARCLGSCGLAPVLVIDGQVVGRETAEGTVTRLSALLGKEAVR
jgi:bidirectional [NiFe] hydrogenase diaphorase subunit